MTSAPNTLPALSMAQTEVLLSGNSIYLELGKGQDTNTVLYYGDSGAVRVLHASGKRDSGHWFLQEDGSYAINWILGPKGSRSRLYGKPGEIRIFDLAGEPRGRVVKIVPGLAPEFH